MMVRMLRSTSYPLNPGDLYLKDWVAVRIIRLTTGYSIIGIRLAYADRVHIDNYGFNFIQMSNHSGIVLHEHSSQYGMCYKNKLTEFHDNTQILARY